MPSMVEKTFFGESRQPLRQPSSAEKAGAEQKRFPPDLRDLRGPFDIIGDVHGCFAELCELLEKLGCAVDAENFRAKPPDGRTVIFLGDLADRGPDSVKVFRLAMNMAVNNSALCLPGNHENKLLRYLEGLPVRIGKGIKKTIGQLESETPEFIARLKNFLLNQTCHFVLDGGNLVCSHAGLPEQLHGRSSPLVHNFCLFGSPAGESDNNAIAANAEWVKSYRGKALMVYGHFPKLNVAFKNNTIDLDNACVFGGSLASLRYPEIEIVKVKAREVYTVTSKPIPYA